MKGGRWILWKIAEESNFHLMPKDVLETWTIDELWEYLAYLETKR